MNEVNPRATMIMGAGAVLDMNFPSNVLKPTTGNIMQEVIKPYCDIFDKNKKITVVDKIYKYLENAFPQNSNIVGNKNVKNDIHFEILFHVMEQLMAYESVWNGRNHNPDMFPYFAPFTAQKFVFDYNDLRQVMKPFIIRIMDIVNAYNEYFRNDKGTEDWFRDFFKSDFKWDVFNFNYDTTVEQSLGKYEDGFDNVTNKSYAIFRPKKIWENVDKLSTVNHIHGCINYFYKDNTNDDIFETNIHDLYLYPNYKAVKDRMTNCGQSNPTAQNNETYYAGPIITGLRKTDKLSCMPYDFYHGNMYNAIVRNNALVIVGYSFGDIYVNNLINRMHGIWSGKERIVLIDKWDETKINNNERLLEQYIYTLSHGEREFLEIMSGCNDISAMIKDFISPDIHKAQYASNGNLLLVTSGMKEASTIRNEIYDFLKS